jgi:hypothetical protein
MKSGSFSKYSKKDYRKEPMIPLFRIRGFPSLDTDDLVG